MRWTGLAIALLGAAACSSAAAPKADEALAAPDAWVAVTNPTLGFEARFPVEPVRDRQEHEDERGVWVNHAFSTPSDTPDGDRLAIGVKDYTRYRLDGANPDAILDAMCTSIPKMVPSVTMTSMVALAEPLPGRACEFHDSARDQRVQMWTYWRSPYLYVLTASCRVTTCAGQRDDTDRFRGSVRFIAPAP